MYIHICRMLSLEANPCLILSVKYSHYVYHYIYIHLGKFDHDLTVLPHYNHGLRGIIPKIAQHFRLGEL